MEKIKESIESLINKFSEIGVSTSDRIVIYENDLYKEAYDNSGYFVSTSGKILGPRGNLLKLEEHYTGYYKVHMRDKKCFVHRVVMLTFFHPGESADSMVVNHMDLNKKNNDISNLEWVTYRQNINHYNNRNTWKDTLKKKIMSLTTLPSEEEIDAMLSDI